ncbi:unnamed protein product [Rotaria sordida]|uniref:Protein kinase domain-containing protein n=2 Tax=Rotaria sordida TaxID=392033 RepID=A0A818PB95_9BILA|nr:unnamed protein product [Rotaria sordida]CAF3617459.1 unnamed protein product [Rotaria sordida]CAF3664939.1 unnamed protein product [Rotaria sordida]
MATNERTKRDSTDRNLLSKILNDLERSDKTDNQRLEDKALDDFQSKFSSKAKFSTNSEHKQFFNILHFIIKKKLLNPTNKLCSLSIFYCLRVLLRDPEYQLVFVQENGMIGLKTQMDLYLNIHSTDQCGDNNNNNESTYTACKVLVHMLNILLKLIMHTPNHIEREYIISSEIIEPITRLLNNTQDLIVLQNILRLLMNMIDQTELYVKEIIKLETIDSLLQILLYKDLEIKQLSLQLMANFLGHPEGRECIPCIPNDFLDAFTSHLSHNNVKVLDHAIWCLTHCAENEDNRRQIRLTGAIPLLLSILDNGNRFFDFSLPSINTNQRQTGQNSKKHTRDDTEAISRCDQLFDMESACCTCLAELSYDYTNGQTIIEQNGIYILATLLFSENEDYQRLEKFHHLQRNIFRTLRYLFSLNKNRDQYRRLLPTHIFELFLSIGNFQRDLNIYKSITDVWNSISIDDLNKIKLERLQTLNPKQEPTRFIRDYGVYECLGSGAFGSVYRVARRGTTMMYALKEIDNRSLNTDSDRSLGQKINEVKIIREELRHPNIVSYYRIFAENDKLYIVMELIAGSSLQDYLSLLKATNRTMIEENIWKIFIQLILALRYLHKEKGIVHRDLTANNIMLDDEYRVKITDFGLAKLRDNDCSKMNSVVGTLYYACPEIIQHMPYNEKADIWSLGCVFYHILTLVPPFYTSNLFLLASKICAGEYDQIPLKYYSDRIRQIIIECLCIDPQHRPDICCIAQLCTEQLMLYTDRSCTTIQILEKRFRQQDHQREFNLIRQQSQLQQQQQQQQQSCISCSSPKESLGCNSSGIGDVSFDGIDGQHDMIKQDVFTAVSDCETSDIPSKELINTAIPQPPSGPIRQNNIRRSRGRLSSEQSLNSNEAILYQTRSPELSNISFENGYDSTNTIQQPIPPSSNMERKQSPFNRSRQPSVTGSITISQKRLRPTDPVSQLLDIVHKLVYISFVPSNINNNKYRRLIDRYRIFLFSKSSSQNLKSELSKLSNHLSDSIEFDSGIGRQNIGLQSLTNSSRSSSPCSLNLKAIDLTIPDGNGCVTYEQMMTYIEQYLQETDYYKDTIMSISSSESLPPAIQRSQRPPSGKK